MDKQAGLLNDSEELEPPLPGHWRRTLRAFLLQAGLRESLRGFDLDMIVLNEAHEKNVVKAALDRLVLSLQHSTQETEPDTDVISESQQESRILEHTPPSVHPIPPRTMNRSISRFLAENRARSDYSNLREFIRPAKKRRLDADKASASDLDEASFSARTATVEVNRDVQMKYDIAKNPDGPLGRTMLGKLSKPEPRGADGQGTGGVLSALLKNALSGPEIPKLARHPGLQERFHHIEDHLAIRWVPGPPEDIRLRLKSIEEHIIKLEREYPPWASLQFNQPRVKPDITTHLTHPIIIPSHLTLPDSTPLPTRADVQIPSHIVATSPMMNAGPSTGKVPKEKKKGRKSTLMRAVMDKIEIAQAISEGATPAPVPNGSGS